MCLLFDISEGFTNIALNPAACVPNQTHSTCAELLKDKFCSQLYALEPSAPIILHTYNCVYNIASTN